MSHCRYRLSSGPREILNRGKYGKLVPVGNCEAMAKAIIEALDAPKDSLKVQDRACKLSLKRNIIQYAKVMGVACPSLHSTTPA